MPRITLCLPCLVAASAAASHLEIVGFTELQARYGTNLASGARAVVAQGGIPYLSLTFFRQPQSSDVTDIIEVSDDLIDWITNAVQAGSAQPNTNGSEIVTFRDTIPVDDADRHFIRPRVERIPD